MATPVLDTPRGVGGKINRNTGQLISSQPSSYAPAPSAPVIDVAGLQEPQKLMDVPPAPPPTQAVGLNAQLGTQADTFIAGLDKEADRAASREDASFEALIKAMSDTQGETALQDKLYSQEGGVDDTSKIVRDLNAQILAEKEALLTQEEELRKNPQGLFGGALEDKIQDLRDDSLKRTTRLSIQQYVAQQNYQGAKEIADRAVAALTEKQRTKLDILSLIYQNNKDEFSKAEQRAFEAAQEARKRKADNEEYRLRAQFDQQIKQADPLYQANLTKARADLATAVGIQTASPLQLSKQQASISDVTTLALDPALKGAVGPNALARFAPIQGFTGQKSNFIAGVEQLRSQLNLETLIQAKAQGATFGALSDQELKILASSATKIGTWAIKDGDGNITGYNTSEKAFKEELNRINNFAKLDYVLKGGDMGDVGVRQMEDGTLWTQNPDGSYTKLQ